MTTIKDADALLKVPLFSFSHVDIEKNYKQAFSIYQSHKYVEGMKKVLSFMMMSNEFLPSDRRKHLITLASVNVREAHPMVLEYLTNNRFPRDELRILLSHYPIDLVKDLNLDKNNFKILWDINHLSKVELAKIGSELGYDEYNDYLIASEFTKTNDSVLLRRNINNLNSSVDRFFLELLRYHEDSDLVNFKKLASKNIQLRSILDKVKLIDGDIL